jgi:hypothetical protein
MASEYHYSLPSDTLTCVGYLEIIRLSFKQKPESVFWLHVHNPHLIGICSIALSSIIAFWGFGLAEKIIPQEKIPQIGMPDSNPPIQIIKNPVLSALADESENTSKPAYEKKPSTIERTDKSVLHLESLEKREFQLNLRGTYYAGSPNTSKPASLAMKIHPIQGANLENFEVIETKMMFDNSRISIENTSIAIKGNNVLMTFTSAAGSFVIKGTLDDSLLSDKNNKQTIVIQNQLFYLVQKDIPYHLDMAGFLSNS